MRSGTHRPGSAVSFVDAEASLAKVRATSATLDRLLHENLLPFWYPRTLDRERGGYRLNHDARGVWSGPADRQIVTQARTLWFFARLLGESDDRLPDRAHLEEAARHGLDFLRSRLWDDRYGGYLWTVGPDGRVTSDRKHMFGQTFALYALAELALRTGDRAVADMATETFETFDRHAHDEVHGGYRDRMTRDWSPVPRSGPDDPPVKTTNVQLHALEALTTYVDLCRAGLASSNEAEARLSELIDISCGRVTLAPGIAGNEGFEADWTPVSTARDRRVSYGHDLENVSLLIEACRAANRPSQPLIPGFRATFENAARFGYDRRKGCVHSEGRLGSPADDRARLWWVQAEALLAAAHMLRLTGEGPYADLYLDILGWIMERQVDWRYGEWHARIGRWRDRRLPKADEWKGPYHNGRAVLECRRLLKDLRPG